VENLESRRIALTLARRAADGADSAQLADAVVSIWQEIDAALRPIIGQRGVASLYRRSLHLAATTHPWLADVRDANPAGPDLVSLQATFAKQDSGAASVAGGDFLQTFHELLASLVGASLTEQLLRSIWANSSSGEPAQDQSR
jgi:hypothetical protein